MGTFDIKIDAPGLLRAESLNISIKFDRTGPYTGRISWNIPTPAAGCSSLDQAYCGMLVTLDNTPASGTKIPVNGTVYNSDINVDTNRFAGDLCGTAKVIGAFYEDRTTTFFDIQGLTPNTPYYISGFPMDCQHRFFLEGVHAYSLDFNSDSNKTNGTNGTQIAILNIAQSPSGVSPDEFTGLMPGINYEFDIQLGVIPTPRTPVDRVYVNPTPTQYTIPVSGSNSAKYKDLVVEINKNLALIGNIPQGPTAPNTGTFYWDNDASILYKWNGTSNVVVDNVIVQSTSPDTVINGSYWYNPSAGTLSVRSTPSIGPATWDPVAIITSTINPLAPISDKSYWFDGTNSYVWNGYSWCKTQTYIQDIDPSVYVRDLIGSYWFNNVSGILYKWDNNMEMWITTDAIQYHEDPHHLTIGTYWFDESSNTLQSWGYPAIGWNQQPNLSVIESAPSIPAPGKFWYNPASQELKQWDGLLLKWNPLLVLSYPMDPTITKFCDAWWNTETNVMYTWDGINSTWIPVVHFYDQINDPSAPVVVANGATWFCPILKQLSVWNKNCFVPVDYITYPTDPTKTLPDGLVWFNPTNNQYNVFHAATEWTSILPVITTNDPTILPVNLPWFNPISKSLQVWNGLSWISILFTLTNPAPVMGTLWFDTNSNTLLSWNGISWVATIPKATLELDAHGNFLFTDTTVGSLSFVGLTDITLFKSLSTQYRFNSHQPGTDGVSDQPSYNELGIGTDGSIDERLTVMNEIRYELGYPVMDVELTPEQLDYAITKALGEFRTKSSLAYKRGFFFMRVNPETQRYTLTNKVGGFNKIVDILGVQRLTSSFLSSAHGAGVYGQIVIQHLYNMGTFDLLSYHIMAEYTKQMEVLFAARLTFTWHEQSRELWIHHRFPFSEPMVSVEATVERTEQDLLTDRYTRPWLRRYALATSRLMLAEIRGKYGTLPGAGGGISLNASDLRMAAKEEIDICIQEIDDFIADRPEEIGLGSWFAQG